MSTTIKITIGPIESEPRDRLLALLSAEGFDAFEEKPHMLEAFVEEERFNAGAVARLLENLPYQVERIAEQNWNALWESDFKPVQVGDFCTVRAAFHPPAEHTRFELIITPKMSFGTGHHATSFLMLQQMEGINFEGRDVLDFGTGTGLLAILAEKLGAGKVWAIDNDTWSIANAQENIHLNQCSRINLQLLDNLDFEEKFDIVLANINRHVLLASLEGLKQHLKPGGVLLMSGLLTGDRPIMEAASLKQGFTIVEQKEASGWIILKLEHGDV